MSQLVEDLTGMVGVWHDTLVAWDERGTALDHDPFGGVPGPFPYENLVYVDFDGTAYVQTNVTFRGREPHSRTFEADIVEDRLEFRRLGPDAPLTVGASGGPGLIWYVPDRLDSAGVHRYCEPDLIRLDGDRRWRTTVLWRDDRFVRPMLVTGTRVSNDTASIHPLDPRGADSPIHGDRSVTRQYVARSGQAAPNQDGPAS